MAEKCSLAIVIIVICALDINNWLVKIIVQGVKRGLLKLFLNVNHCLFVKCNLFLSKHATRCVGLAAVLQAGR